ncbi:MAG: sigma-70 family RNA polymerase sigma factor [Planctomycetota bacterium]
MNDPEEKSAFDELRAFLLNSKALWGLTEEEGSDVVDEVCASLCTEQPDKSASELTPLAYFRVRNRSIDLVRRKSRERRILEKIGRGRDEGSSAENPLVQQIAKELKQLLFQALSEKLSRDEKEAIRLRFFNGLTLEATSSSLGRSLSGTNRLIRGALSKLQRELREYGDVVDELNFDPPE